jgi:hypothetical protein
MAEVIVIADGRIPRPQMTKPAPPTLGVEGAGRVV